LSNNRGNNRRRGRGNRNQGNNPINRIDSRARGNAPQLLEKYKKLAHDASLNGDRVQAEYYLQFADHYFRVLADSKAQKDEARQRREDDREQSHGGGDAEDEGGDYDRQPRVSNRRRREQDDSIDGDERGSDSEGLADDNPFTRESRGRKPRSKPQRTKRESASEGGDREDGLDEAVLPPAISRGEDKEEAAEAPKPRRRAPRKRKADGEDETLETVS